MPHQLILTKNNLLVKINNSSINQHRKKYKKNKDLEVLIQDF